MKNWFKDWVSPSYLRRHGVLGMNYRNIGFIAQYNDRSRFPLVDNKLLTKQVVERSQIAAPKLIDVVESQHDIEEIAETLKDLQQFVIKPAHGSGGKGILVITAREGDEFVKASGAHITLDELKRHLSNTLSGLHSLGGRPDHAFVETLVQVGDLFADYSHEGVPDIRIIVFQGYPVMGMLRLATRASDGKANLHQGAVGVGLDLATGRAISAVQHDEPLTHHPDTGSDLARIRIGNWKQLLSLAARCFEVTKLGYLGCDIVIDRERGPLILELNARPGLSVQIANGAGLIPRLHAVEALGDVPVDVADRVEYSMTHFGSRSAAAQETLWEEETIQ